MGSGRYDGANRNDYFQGVSIAPAGAAAVTRVGTALRSLAPKGRGRGEGDTMNPYRTSQTPSSQHDKRK
jgi:hypothetical protein